MRWTRLRASDGHPESGSEVVSTVLVQGLVVLVILLLAQIAFASHVRTMSVSAASEGARRGGLLGGDEEEAAARTGELLDRSWAPPRTARSPWIGRATRALTSLSSRCVRVCPSWVALGRAG